MTALVGEVAAYVAPAPKSEQPGRGQGGGGRSQGANAQRKRAAREATDILDKMALVPELAACRGECSTC